jgi:hypothetical protein
MKDYINRLITREVRKTITESVSNEVYIIKNKDGEPIEQFEKESDAKKALAEYKKKEPKQQLIIEKGKRLSFDELDKMSEKMEGNAFTGALKKAKESGDDEFTVDGKKYDVKERKMECKECSSKGSMNEKKCSKCGKTICECKSSKKMRIKESVLIDIIHDALVESHPGIQLQNSLKTKNGKVNSDALSDSGRKMKKYLSFDGNDNPEFPKQIGGKGKISAKRLSDAENEEISLNRGGGMEDLEYNTEVPKQLKDRQKKHLTGDKKLGNDQKSVNSIPSKTGDNLSTKAKKKLEDKKKMPMYKKDPQPVKYVNESQRKDIMKDILDEFNRYKNR